MPPKKSSIGRRTRQAEKRRRNQKKEREESPERFLAKRIMARQQRIRERAEKYDRDRFARRRENAMKQSRNPISHPLPTGVIETAVPHSTCGQIKHLDEINLPQKTLFGNMDFKKRQMPAVQTATPSTQVAGQPASRHIQVLAPPGQRAEPEPFRKPKPKLKLMLVVPNHQHSLLSNLSSLWKNRNLCDAGISNGISTVKVHKVVLVATSPKLVSVISTDLASQDFLQVNFPKEVSTEALNAFAEFMYNGILCLDLDILKQLKIIAKKLDMKEFEQLCDSHLPKDFPQSADAAKLPLIEMFKSSPAMISLLNTFRSPISMDSTPSVDMNQESTQSKLGQVTMKMNHMFDQKSEGASLAPNKPGNLAGDVIYPRIKTEPVEQKDNKYGHFSSRSHQVFTPTTSPSLSACASISSLPASSTELSIPFSQLTDSKSTKLKPTHSYETPLVSDVSPVSCIGEPICSQSNPMNEDSSKQLSRQSLPTPSLHLPPTSTNNQVMYPGGPFTTSADNQNFARSANVGADTPHSQPNAMKGFPSKPLSRQSIPTSSIEYKATSTNNPGIYDVSLFMAGDEHILLLTPKANSTDSYRTGLT